MLKSANAHAPLTFEYLLITNNILTMAPTWCIEELNTSTCYSTKR